MIINLLLVLLGFAIATVFWTYRYLNGRFDIYTEDVTKDVYRLNLTSLDMVDKRKFILLKVKRF